MYSFLHLVKYNFIFKIFLVLIFYQKYIYSTILFITATKRIKFNQRSIRIFYHGNDKISLWEIKDK